MVQEIGTLPMASNLLHHQKLIKSTDITATLRILRLAMGR